MDENIEATPENIYAIRAQIPEDLFVSILSGKIQHEYKVKNPLPEDAKIVRLKFCTISKTFDVLLLSKEKGKFYKDVTEKEFQKMPVWDLQMEFTRKK